ncbi:MAG TPA: SDR family NAD(P)-dependent oxidoreductase [Mycobacteriales bacterium]|nr:SDR family NAD(P)-dependent oxidoreductase [Mycobacteriales bacterium]
MTLQGKCALVTGASRGIGEFIAYELARQGANVAVMAKSTRDAPNPHFGGTIEQTAERVREFGVDVLEVQGDVSHEDDVERVRDAVLDRFGRCDVLVNNAAASYLAPFLELSVKRWDIVQGVNLRGPMLLCKAFLPAMVERGSGHIVNISSADGRLDLDSIAASAAAVGSRGDEASFGTAGQDLSSSTTAYGTSKAALNRFTLGLAREMHGRGVAVNALEVSAVTEPVRLNLPHADFSKNELPEAPAQLVAWIAQQPADYTGQILVQSELLDRLRREGAVRPKVDPR